MNESSNAARSVPKSADFCNGLYSPTADTRPKGGGRKNLLCLCDRREQSLRFTTSSSQAAVENRGTLQRRVLVNGLDSTLVLLYCSGFCTRRSAISPGRPANPDLKTNAPASCQSTKLALEGGL